MFGKRGIKKKGRVGEGDEQRRRALKGLLLATGTHCLSMRMFRKSVTRRLEIPSIFVICPVTVPRGLQRQPAKVVRTQPASQSSTMVSFLTTLEMATSASSSTASRRSFMFLMSPSRALVSTDAMWLLATPSVVFALHSPEPLSSPSSFGASVVVPTARVVVAAVVLVVLVSLVLVLEATE